MLTFVKERIWHRRSLPNISLILHLVFTFRGLGCNDEAAVLCTDAPTSKSVSLLPSLDTLRRCQQ